MNEIKNVVIFDGEREFSTEEINADPNLTLLRNSVQSLGGFTTISDRINDEDGILYITTDKSYKSGSGKLKNVSDELQEEYEKVRP